MARPVDYDELLARVVEALGSDDMPAARRLLVRSLQKVTDSEERGALLGLQLGCVFADDPEAGRAQVSEIVAQDRADEPFVSGVGCALSDLGENGNDRRLLDLAESVFSSSPLPHLSWRFHANHALVLERLERYEEAASYYRRASEVGPDEAELLVHQAGCLHRADQFAEAAGAYRRYLTANPTDANIWIALAIVECDAGNYDAAEQAYWRAGGLDPNNISLHYNWLITAFRCDKTELARDACRRLQSIAPDEWRTRLAAAQVLRADGNASEAFERTAMLFEEEAAADGDNLEHIAIHALGMARDAGAPAGAALFITRLCVLGVLTEDVLASIRALESPERERLASYDVFVKARGREAAGDPTRVHAYIVRYHVFADSADAAGEIAAAFERRCGADDARADEVDEQDGQRAPRHRGPWWRASTKHAFPIDEYED